MSLPLFSGSLAYAPVTKASLVVIGLTSTLAGIFNQQGLFNVPLSPHLVRDWQYWRILTSQICFANSAELLFGMLLLFNGGSTIEKLFGSVKFGSFLLVSWLLSSFFSLCILFLFSAGTSSATLPAGPIAILFSMLFQYYHAVPPTYRFEIFGGHFSNKSFLYFFAIQLLSCQPTSSVVPALAGLVSGAIIRSNVLGLRQFRLPYPVVHLLSKTRPLLGSNRIHRRSNRTTPDASRSHQPVVPSSLSAALGGRPQTAAPANRGGPANGGGPTPSALQEWRTAFSGTAQARPLQVDPDAISNLQAMFPGTSRQAAEEALRNSNNDVNRAVEALLANAS